MTKKTLLLFVLLIIFFSSSLSMSDAQAPEWAILSSDIKIIPSRTAITNQIPELYAAQGEYVPFQIMLRGENTIAPTIEADNNAFIVTRYEQWFFPIQETWSPQFYSSAWIEGDYIADGLLAISDNQLRFGRDNTSAVWIDVFVKPDALPGEYTISVTVNDETRSIPLRVYPVFLEPIASMSVILPIDDGMNSTFFAQQNGMDLTAYHQEINETLYEHYMVSGEFLAQPIWTGISWDFSGFTAEINRIPIGDTFHAPSPFDLQTQSFYFLDLNGIPYTRAAFDEPHFVEQLDLYFHDLHDYLLSIGRLADAELYPTDESFWVADEPDNNGPAGLMRLEQWAQVIFEHDLALMGSRVLPVAWGPNWIQPERLITDSHVPVAYLDAAPQLFADWAAQPNRSVSIYLNGYGDLINISAAMNRGIIWHAYARDIRTIAGYGILEWYDTNWNLIDPVAKPDDYLAYAGYGSGAMIYPNGLPGIRLKLLREGVEDARLLDLYTRQGGDARALATCLTPVEIALQNPPETIWNEAHHALLEAVSKQTIIDLKTLCPSPISYRNLRILHTAEEPNSSDWELDGVSLEIIPFQLGQGLQMRFFNTPNSALFWYGSDNWTNYDTLLLDIYSESPYFTDLDIAVGDSSGNYLLFANSSQIIPPNEMYTLTIPLTVPPFSTRIFDWQSVAYMELSVPQSIERRDIETSEVFNYETGERTLIIGQIRLAHSSGTD
jgi:hypothetical protein